MIDLSSYLLAGFSVLPTVDITIQGVTVPCVFNQSEHNDNKVLGGMEPDNLAIVSIKTSLLTNPKSLKGKTVTLDGDTWRVLSVVYGKTITNLKLMAENKM